MNAVLIQQAYPEGKFPSYIGMLELTAEHNKKYCERHGFDYWCEISENEDMPLGTGGWRKIELILKALEHGYQYIVWLDADAMIKDVDTDLRDAVEVGKIGACWHRIPQLNHWNVGVLYLHNAPQVVEFVRQWLASYPPPNDGWYEQGVFNRMGMQSKVVSTISDKWNSTIDVSLVPDAVVLGFHGQGDAKQRTKIMTDAFNRLFPNEKALATQGMSEVNNG